MTVPSDLEIADLVAVWFDDLRRLTETVQHAVATLVVDGHTELAAQLTADWTAAHGAGPQAVSSSG